MIQVLEPGECFGHPSLLTGMAPAYTVRARELGRCRALLAAREARTAALGTEPGAAYVASCAAPPTRSSRGTPSIGFRDVGTTPVSAIFRPAALV